MLHPNCVCWSSSLICLTTLSMTNFTALLHLIDSLPGDQIFVAGCMTQDWFGSDVVLSVWSGPSQAINAFGSFHGCLLPSRQISTLNLWCIIEQMISRSLEEVSRHIFHVGMELLCIKLTHSIQIQIHTVVANNFTREWFIPPHNSCQSLHGWLWLHRDSWMQHSTGINRLDSLILLEVMTSLV